MLLPHALIEHLGARADIDLIAAREAGGHVLGTAEGVREGGAQRPRMRHREELLLHDARNRPLVRDDARALRVIDGHERRLVEERDLPQLLRVVEVEPAIRVGLQDLAVDEEPLARVRAREVDAVVEKPDRRAPERVRNEAPDPGLAVFRIHERARALELLDLLHDGSGFLVEQALRHAVRPHGPHDVGLRARAEAEMRGRNPDRARDVQVPRLHLDEAADPLLVHLARARLQPLENDVQPAVRVSAVVDEDAGLPAGRHEKVEIPVLVDVDGKQRIDVRQVRGERRRRFLRRGREDGPIRRTFRLRRFARRGIRRPSSRR